MNKINLKLMKTNETLRRVSKNGGSGIRTHGTLADMLVFKNRIFLVIAADLIGFKEMKRPKVDH